MFLVSILSVIYFLSQQEWIGIRDVDFSNNQPKAKTNTTSTERASRSYQSSFPRPPQCTKDDLMKVRHQLPPELCIWANIHNFAHLQLCSITAATKCPKAAWLDDHYLGLQKNSTKNIDPPPPFLGISVGCNKGFDAINTLRMGTYDDTINKKDWKEALIQDGSLSESVCNQDLPQDVFKILQPYKKISASTNTTSPNRPIHPHGEMHCIEPMPQTFLKLNHSAETLGYRQKGLRITNAAVSKESGKMLFPTAGQQGGVENKGLDACGPDGPEDNKMCEYVNVYSLDDFVNQKVKANGDDPINILNIDVEGFDGDVLFGATEFVLKRVEYLEFEYNWMGSWKTQHLYDIVKMLDVVGGFTCYWAGVDRLWRITDCWMAYYDVKTWSNVACVNRHLAPKLGSRMENIFQRTLNDTKQWNTDKSQWIARMSHIRRKISNHFLMSTEEEGLRSKYAQG